MWQPSLAFVQTITVNDTTKPTFNLATLPDIIVPAPATQCAARSCYIAAISDNCSGVTVSGFGTTE